MDSIEVAKLVAVSLEIASAKLRKSRGSRDLSGLIKDTMDSRDVDPKETEAVTMIVSLLLGFSESVRAAERRGDKISSYFTENEEEHRPLIELPDWAKD